MATQHAPSSDPYAGAFVQALFNEMSATYGLVNLVTSFGFSARWRRQCVDRAAVAPREVVYDLMSGMGELWPTLARRFGPAGGDIRAVDFSPGMCGRAQATAARLPAQTSVEVIQRDALNSGAADSAADAIVCSFGLKTLTPEQRIQLAREVARLLKPGGRLAFLEISVPGNRPLRWAYLAYLKRMIPLLGRLLAGNADNYRMLGRYTQAFGDCADFARACAAAGLDVRFETFFFGCATGVFGRRPA